MDACTSWWCDIRLAAQPVSASRARDFVRQRLVEHGLSHLSDDIALVVSELATNAMLHTPTTFKVSLYAFEKTVLLEVEDGLQNGLSRGPAQVLVTGGSGIAIVKLLSREWGVDARSDGGKSVWAEFDRH